MKQWGFKRPTVLLIWSWILTLDLLATPVIAWSTTTRHQWLLQRDARKGSSYQSNRQHYSIHTIPAIPRGSTTIFQRHRPQQWNPRLESKLLSVPDEEAAEAEKESNSSTTKPTPLDNLHLVNVEKTGSPRTWDWWKDRIPNYLTYARLILIPALVYSFYNLSRPWTTACFAVATISDLLDGYLARRWNVTSEFGAFLDPVADKLMVGTCLILLTGQYGPFLALPTCFIIAREISISALREFMANRKLRDTVKVSWAGKLKTALTMVSLTGLLWSTPYQQRAVWHVSLSLLYVSTLLTITSGASYFQAAAPHLLEKE